MDVTIETVISMPKALFDQAETLARQLNIARVDLFARAIDHFIRAHLDATVPGERADEINPTRSAANASRVIHQGDIYWVVLENPGEPEAEIPHPYVVVQDNLFNHSRIQTVVACALTSNLRRTSDTPGNVLLEVGEANLPKQSVVEVSKVTTVEKARLGEYIGSLTEQWINQILAGMRFLQTSFFDR